MKDYEIDREAIVLGNRIGAGIAGTVYEGSAIGVSVRHRPDTHSSMSRITRVAIKMLHESGSSQAQQHDLAEEARRMRNLQHDNIVQLLAVCFRSSPWLIVLEHMANGDLKTYLRSSAAALTVAHKQRMALDVATGLAYLCSVGFVHRDIAARNILLDSDYHGKISDFGMDCIFCCVVVCCCFGR